MKDIEEQEAVLYEKKSDHSGRISESCRYIGFGLVAFYYGLVTSNPPMDPHWAIVWIGIFGVLTLVMDYFQYLGGYFSVKAALKNSNRNFVTSSFSYRTQDSMFWAKQITAIAGALTLGIWVIR